MCPGQHSRISAASGILGAIIKQLCNDMRIPESLNSVEDAGFLSPGTEHSRNNSAPAPWDQTKNTVSDDISPHPGVLQDVSSNIAHGQASRLKDVGSKTMTLRSERSSSSAGPLPSNKRPANGVEAGTRSGRPESTTSEPRAKKTGPNPPVANTAHAATPSHSQSSQVPPKPKLHKPKSLHFAVQHRRIPGSAT